MIGLFSETDSDVLPVRFRLIKEAKIDSGRIFRVDGEVDTCPSPCCSQGIRCPRPYPHLIHTQPTATMERWLGDKKRLVCLFHGYPDRLSRDTREASRLGQITGQVGGSRFSHKNLIMDKTDGTKLVEGKMRKAGISQAAIDAFLFQYRKLLARDTGLIPEDSISPIEQPPRLDDAPASGFPDELLAATVIFKLNGGLGTSMGLEEAKSLLPVRPGLTFLDVIVRQFLQTRSQHSAELGLYFMNSFNTSAGTKDALALYSELGDPAALGLLQSKAPKIDAKTLLPATWPRNPQLEWCPPGHGDIYPSLMGSGLLQSLLSDGKKFLFVSNAD